MRHVGSNKELAKITVENVSDEAGEFGNYSVQIGVEKGKSVGIHQRGLIGFPRKKYNVLGLLLQALLTLDARELEWDGEWETPNAPLRKNVLPWPLRKH